MSFGAPQEKGRPVAVKDEGLTLVASVGSIDFVGAGVTGSTIGTAVTENIPGETSSDFVGDSGAGGVHGLVPAPAAGDAFLKKFLSAGGSFETINTAIPAIYVLRAGDTMTGDLIGKSFVPTRNGTVTRNGDGYITSIALTGGRTLTVTRDGDNFVTSIADGSRTWAFTRNASDYITSWAVT